MTDSPEPINGVLESTAKLAEQMEQMALTQNNVAYLSQRVVKLRAEVLQYQAALSEAQARIEVLMELVPKDINPEEGDGEAQPLGVGDFSDD